MPDVWHYDHDGYDGKRADLVVRCWRLAEPEYRKSKPDFSHPPLGGDRDACRAYARILTRFYAESSDGKISPSMVHGLLETLCARHDVEACTDLGVFLRENGPEKDAPGAEAVLGAACKAGSARACMHFGEHLVNPRRAPELFEGDAALVEGCARGFPHACVLLGGPSRATCDGFTCDRAKSRLPLDYACVWDSRTEGCNDRPRPPAVKTSFADLADQCEAGPSPEPCLVLADARYGVRATKEGLERLEKKTAQEWHERACELGDAKSCFLVAAPLVHGDCPGVDHKRGLPMLERSCELGDPFGCESLAVVYDTGYGLPRNPARAAELRERARVVARPRQH